MLRVINDARASATNSSELLAALDIVKHKASKHALPRWEIARNELLLQGLSSEAQQLETAVDEFEDHYIKTGSAEDAGFGGCRRLQEGAAILQFAAATRCVVGCGLPAPSRLGS